MTHAHNYRVHNEDGACPTCCEDRCYLFTDCCGTNVSYFTSTDDLTPVLGNMKYAVTGSCGDLTEVDPADCTSHTPIEVNIEDFTSTTGCEDVACPECENCNSCGDCCFPDTLTVTVPEPTMLGDGTPPEDSCPGQDPECLEGCAGDPACEDPCTGDCPECIGGGTIADWSAYTTKCNAMFAGLGGSYTLYTGLESNWSSLEQTNEDPPQSRVNMTCGSITLNSNEQSYTICGSPTVLAGNFGWTLVACNGTQSTTATAFGGSGCFNGRTRTAGGATVSWTGDCNTRCDGISCNCSSRAGIACDPTAATPCA